MITCPDCGYTACHQRNDTTAYCPRCSLVFAHNSEFAAIVAELVKPSNPIIWTPSGPKEVNPECYVCGNRWQNGDVAEANNDELFRHKTCEPPSQWSCGSSNFRFIGYAYDAPVRPPKFDNDALAERSHAEHLRARNAGDELLREALRDADLRIEYRRWLRPEPHIENRRLPLRLGDV